MLVLAEDERILLTLDQLGCVIDGDETTVESSDDHALRSERKMLDST